MNDFLSTTGLGRVTRLPDVRPIRRNDIEMQRPDAQ